MSYERYKENLKRNNQLAAVDVLGSFDFYTCIVSLDAIDSDRINEFQHRHESSRAVLEGPGTISAELYHDLSEMLPLTMHEHTHFIDATSTLWGLRHLVSMDSAYASHEAHNHDENQFHHAKLFFDEVRCLKLPEYYTQKSKSNQSERPWQWRTSIGRIFSADGRPTERPVLFSRFSNVDNEHLVRSPLSTVSLLEASAMSQEVWTNMALIKKCEQDFKIVESARYSDQVLDYLYNKDLTEYSVCAHVVANLQRCSDVLLAFALTSKLVRACLNFPQALFDKVQQDCEIHKLIGVDANSSTATAVREGIRLKDRGILFYLLAHALPANSYRSSESGEKGVQASLVTLGVKRDELLAASDEEANQLYGVLHRSRFRAIRLLGAAGHSNFMKIDRTAAHLPFDSLEMPEVYLGDAQSVRIFRKVDGVLNDLSVDDCFDELNAGQEWVTRFSEACV